MAQAAHDYSTALSTSSSTFPATPNYVYTVPPNKFLLLEELSLAVDGSFNLQGRAQIKLRDQIITTQGGAPAAGGIALLANTTLNYKKDSVAILLNTGEQIAISIRSADGSTTVQMQVQLSGYLLDESEARALAKKAAILNGGGFL